MSSIQPKKDKKSKEVLTRRMDTIFDNFREELERTMKWPFNFEW